MNQLIDLIFISKKRNTSFSLKLRVWFITLIVATLTFITISTLVLFLRHTRDTIAQVSLIKAEQENRVLLDKLTSFAELLRDRQCNFENNVAQDVRQRTFWQMANIHQDVWAMGIGGILHEPVVRNISKNTNRLLNEIYESIDILEARCNLRQRSLDEISGQIDKKFQLWSHIPSINPLPGTTAGSDFGYRVDPITKGIRMHEGVDLGAPSGTPIYASADGIVISSGWNMGYGLTVDVDHGYGFISRYAHCRTILVKSGDVIKRGQVLATVGATGRTTCPHLHYEVHVSGVKVNPAYYIDFTNFIVD